MCDDCLLSYVICDKAGTCLRQGSPTGSMPGDIASRYADSMQTLAQKARHVVRDLDPSVSRDGRALATGGVHKQQMTTSAAPAPTC